MIFLVQALTQTEKLNWLGFQLSMHPTTLKKKSFFSDDERVISASMMRYNEELALFTAVELYGHLPI